ncbi:hypothetical protein SDC9_168346 [bioreactor metagenome]|uniref:Uncharacterized protein n=1 Tax=bioreactor metagenome TaxID=1076179 RepID=A0A645G284_9ZZZZ
MYQEVFFHCGAALHLLAQLLDVAPQGIAGPAGDSQLQPAGRSLLDQAVQRIVHAAQQFFLRPVLKAAAAGHDIEQLVGQRIHHHGVQIVDALRPA